MKIITETNNYYSSPRDDIACLIEKGNHAILELGCGTGKTAELLRKEKKAAFITGIEKNPDVCEEARKNMDTLICSDLEELSVPLKLESFDYIIAGDVLEHLYDPWQVVKDYARYLKKNGIFIASIPNIRNYGILKRLVFKGSWEYALQGELDKTHIRFFTKKSIQSLFEENGYIILQIDSKYIDTKTSRIFTKIYFIRRYLEEFLTYTYIVKAQRIDLE